MGKHIRNWQPCSSFSKFSFGTLIGICIQLIFPETSLLWIGILLFFVSGSHFLKKRFQISEYIIFGIFFLLLATTLCPERFQRETGNQTFSFSRKNLFGKTETFFQDRFRERILRNLKEAGLEKNTNRIALGLVFGEAKQLSKDFKQKAKEGGILHLFAASGLHLGILMGVQFRLLNLFPILGYSAPRIFPLLTGFLYLSALGYPVSLTRAWIFAGILLVQGLFFRKLRPIDLLLCSAWILWIWDPPRFYSVSFCLSFGAVSGIFLFSYPIKLSLDFISTDNSFLTFFKENLTVSFSAGLGTMPVLLFSFGAFSFGSILLNLVVVPLAGILLPILYLSLILHETRIRFLLESSWSVTEFLIQILFYLSNTLSKPLGFYKEMGDALWLGIAGWAILSFSVIFFAVFLEKNFLRKKESQDPFQNIQNKEYTFNPETRMFSKKSYSYFCILFFLGIFGIHFFLYKAPDQFPQQNRIVNNRFFFLLRNGDSLFFSGKCKYANKKIANVFRTSKRLYCDSLEGEFLKKIHVDDESCLTWAFLCAQESSKPELFYAGRDVDLWNLVSRIPLKKSDPIREIQLPGDSKILFFHTKKDSLSQLAQKTKSGQGWILLETPYGSTDRAEVWNQNRKLLGLSESWLFLEKDELQRIPLSKSF
ncbi:ComEC/Rec2 family competence protein [Leptospira sp. 201903070]|uniref:ComEC/Rec2 family competence protein n=1 Tax=Leptospira ainlahdjerensis TaxID=2810033 RepID=A0ABS2UH89_9LEPT|nr:ComEC/Rec2 family competence protein [Leptospira ainlahdjerensis]MBM9578240.1 ComEC/Rec2 family competence protein [Leptospira ainlahdjerensis]